MADLKISQLPIASTPLAGTEVLPIVQDGETRKVAVEDLFSIPSVILESLDVDDLKARQILIDAINKIIVSTPNLVDLIPYDTTKDSDGGAWRKRCQHLSWYNEPLNTETRGKTREFPSLALIVATTTTVTIYDATDPSLPMWMVFSFGGTFPATYILGVSGSTVASIFAVNGHLFVGGSEGFRDISFVGDQTLRISATQENQYVAGIAARNTTSGYRVSGTRVIANATINDVTATVLPGAPIDPATGLPVPTVAVATAGGVSVIKHDGTVVNSADTNAFQSVAIIGEDLFYSSAITAAIRFARGLGSLGAGFSGSYYNSTTTPSLSFPVAAGLISVASGGAKATGTSTRLQILSENPATPANGMVAYVTKDYFSGILPGDIRRAWLASGTAETLSGANLVTNGGFDTDTAWTKGTGWSISGGQASKAGGNNGTLSQTIGVVSGRRYDVTWTVISISGGQARAKIGSGEGPLVNSPGTYVHQIVASANDAALNFVSDIAASLSIDNVSVRPVDEDRSVKAKGIGVYGTLTKAPVATGAELMGYSGFSAANYLEEPYSADLDFGTGDFVILGWFEGTPTTFNQTIIARGYYGGGSWSGNGYFEVIVVANDGKLRLAISDDNRGTFDTITSANQFADGNWHAFAIICRSGKLELYVDGVKSASDVTISAASAGITNTQAVTRIGYRQDSTNPLSNGNIALLRLAAFAPSPEQIRAIYEAEKHLFVDNAKCLLGGTSNTIKALAHDPDTDQLYVGTADGVSVFQGLRRVNYLKGAPMTSANIKAIGAARGAVLVGTAAEAYYSEPERNLRDPQIPVTREKQLVTANFTATAAQVDFTLPLGAATVVNVFQNGLRAREGSGSSATRYTVLDDGFRKTVRFGAAPGDTVDVSIEYYEEI